MLEACNPAEENSERKKEQNAQVAECVGEAGRILASGVDSVDLSLYVTWRNEDFFKLLENLKANAKANGAAMPGAIEALGDRWIFNVKAHGSEGYAYLITSAEFELKVLQAMRPRQRPSVVISIRSATLWHRGVVESVDWMLELLRTQGAIIDKAMIGRGDPCADILVRDSLFNTDLKRHAVKRARQTTSHDDGDLTTGLKFGAGSILARLYDKPLEIETKSKKFWMYDIWQLKEVPPGHRIIRVEFQIRREAFKELGIDTIWQFTNYARNLWAYCTQNWLKFQDRPDLHHTQQRTMPWWSTIQNGFLGGQRGCPLVRAKQVGANKMQLAQQMFGQLTSLLALDSDGDITPGGEIQIEQPLSTVIESAELIGMTPSKCFEQVRRKLAKQVKSVSKFLEAEEKREALGLPLMRKKEDRKNSANSNGGSQNGGTSNE